MRAGGPEGRAGRGSSAGPGGLRILPSAPEHGTPRKSALQPQPVIRGPTEPRHSALRVRVRHMCAGCARYCACIDAHRHFSALLSGIEGAVGLCSRRSPVLSALSAVCALICGVDSQLIRIHTSTGTGDIWLAALVKRYRSHCPRHCSIQCCREIAQSFARDCGVDESLQA